VKAQLDLTGPFRVDVRDVVWKRTNDLEFLARLHAPAGATAPVSGRPVVVEVHGGAWTTRDRRRGDRYNSGLAAAGCVVVAIDFRMGPEFKHPAASDDVVEAVDWVKANADELGVDPGRLVLIGSSSGGHLALLAALSLPEPVQGVVALWPPVDPMARRTYAIGRADKHGDVLARSTEAYFETETAMKAASIARLVRDGEALSLPPALVVYPMLDRNVPIALIDDLALAYRQSGGDLTVRYVPGQEHAYGHRQSVASDDLIAHMRAAVAVWTR
jgi:acetyl esterase